MNFLDSLAQKYKELELGTPDWINEAGTMTPPIPAAPATTPAATTPTAPTTPTTQSQSVVNALMKAMDVLQDDPEIQKVKTTVAQKVTDAKKQITDTGAKVVSTIDQALQNLGKITSSTTTGGATPVTPSTSSITGAGR